MKLLPIIWQRLVNSAGQTCNRCGVTYEALQRAIAKLDDESDALPRALCIHRSGFTQRRAVKGINDE